MVERETQKLTTPKGHEVEMRTYLEAGEVLDMETDAEGKALSQKELGKKILEVAVVSIDGAKDNIPAALRKLPVQDYIFLSKEVAKLTDSDFQTAK